MQGELQILCGDVGLADFYGIVEQGPGVNDFRINVDLAAADPGEIQQVIDEASFELDVAADDLKWVAH